MGSKGLKTLSGRALTGINIPLSATCQDSEWQNGIKCMVNILSLYIYLVVKVILFLPMVTNFVCCHGYQIQ